MKHNYLFIAALALSGALQAHAQTWTEATPNATPLALGDTVYLYNPEVKAFLLGANENKTRASYGQTGFKVVINKHLGDDGSWDGRSYVINDFVESKNMMRKMYHEEGTLSSWMDATAQADTIWTIEQHEGSYRLRATSKESEEAGNPVYYLGVNTAHANDNRLYLIALTVDDGGSHYVDWQMVSPAEYRRVQDKHAAIAEATLLKSTIDMAKELGVDVTAAETAYGNTDNTAAALAEARQQLRKAIGEALSAKATPDSPSDMSSLLIENPDYADNNNNGWSGTAPGAVNYNAAEQFSRNFDYYQTLHGLFPGVYRLSLTGFYRAGLAASDYAATTADEASTRNAKLYAETGGETYSKGLVHASAEAADQAIGGAEVSVGDGQLIPDNMEAAAAYFNNGKYADNSVIFVVTADTVKIGLKKEQLIKGDWTIFSHWRMQYYGNSDASYAYWRDSYLSENSIADEDGVACSKDVKAAYDQALATARSASTPDDIKSAIAAFNAASDSLKANIAAYGSLGSLIDKSAELLGSGKVAGAAVSALIDYLSTVQDKYSAGAYSTAEALAETDKVQALYDEASKSGLQEGADCTELIVNPNFNDGSNGWSHDTNLGGQTVGGSADNPSVESWNSNFNFYQDIKGVANGVYRLQVQAYNRTAANATAWSQKDDAETVTSIYINDNKQLVKNVMDEAQSSDIFNGGAWRSPDNTYVPNSLSAASIAFSNNLYDNEVYGVVTDGKLRIGIQSLDGSNYDRWSAWDNFRLTYEGFNADILKTLLDNVISNAETHISDKADQQSIETLTTAIDNGRKAEGSDDGDTMFKAVVAINNAVASITAAQDAYENLEEVYTQLASTLESTSETATESAKANAESLIGEAEGHLADMDLNLTEVQSFLQKLKGAILALQVPYETATDDNPVDMTSAVITNPTYSSNNKEGWSGSNPGFQRYGLAEFWNANYDFYQDIEGLPSGTYAVVMDGFYRAGYAEDDYKAYNADATKDNNALLYAQTTEGTVSATLHRISSEAGEAVLSSGEALVAADTYVPDNMASASAWINAGKYADNTVLVKVNDGKLRIGVKKTTLIGGDWTILDNWQLIYYGANSSKTTGEETGISNLTETEKAGANVYNLSGQVVRANATSLQGLPKGIYIFKGKKYIVR